MRITPLEIRQKGFEKHFRGYDRDEVNGFLLTLSQEWERILDENKELRIKLDATEKEVTKLREVESSLYKTLKTAEDTGANVIEQARTAADLHLRESQIKSDGIVNEAKIKAKNTIEEAEARAKEVLTEMEERLKLMIDKYKQLEASREDLLADLRRLADDTLQRVERAKKLSHEFNADSYVNTVRRETKSAVFPNSDFSKPPVQESQTEKIIVEKKVVIEEKEPKKVNKSFFDNIE